MASVIDKLPEAERKKVIDALLAGATLRDVAKQVGVSHTAIGNYKDRVLLPTIRAAQKINAVRQLAETPEQQAADTAQLTRAALSSAPILARIEQHRATVDQVIEKSAKKGDARGTAALISADMKGLELQARMTGALDSAPSTVNNIQFVSVPGSGAPAQITDGTGVMDCQIIEAEPVP